MIREPIDTPHVVQTDAICEAIVSHVNAMMASYAPTRDEEGFTDALDELFDHVAITLAAVATQCMENPNDVIVRMLVMMHHTCNMVIDVPPQSPS